MAKTKMLCVLMIALLCSFLLVPISGAQEVKKSEDVLYRVSQGVLIGGTAYNWYNTRADLDSRMRTTRGYEDRTDQTAAMSAVSGLVFMVSHELHESGHRKAATIMNFFAGGIHIGVAVKNR